MPIADFIFIFSFRKNFSKLYDGNESIEYMCVGLYDVETEHVGAAGPAGSSKTQGSKTK